MEGRVEIDVNEYVDGGNEITRFSGPVRWAEVMVRENRVAIVRHGYMVNFVKQHNEEHPDKRIFAAYGGHIPKDNELVDLSGDDAEDALRRALNRARNYARSRR